MIHCVKLGKSAEGLDMAPWPGELGQRIFEQISKEAWQQWMAHQTILVNENRINPMNPEHRKFIAAEMEKFLFGEGSELPDAFRPEDTKP
jgi:Fe-S cluster biosynthesis and repair protein YggX